MAARSESRLEASDEKTTMKIATAPAVPRSFAATMGPTMSTAGTFMPRCGATSARDPATTGTGAQNSPAVT